MRKSSVDSKISGFGRPQTRARRIQKSPLWRAVSKRCGFGERVHWFRVDGRPIRIKIYAVSKLSILSPSYLCHRIFCQAIWTIKPGFHTLVSDVRIVSVAECFGKRSGRSYGNTFGIISNNPYIRSESIVPIEPCSILGSRLHD